MQDYDVTLKLLLRGSASRTMHELTGAAVERWLDVELPKVQNTRVDLLGENHKGDLFHMELQSGNDAMPLRMAEYCIAIYRLFGVFPHQIVLYVGEPPLRMDSELHGPDFWFRYRVIDIRELDGDRLLDSEDVGDKIIAILTRLRDHWPDTKTHGDLIGGQETCAALPVVNAIRQIVEKIAGLTAAERE